MSALDPYGNAAAEDACDTEGCVLAWGHRGDCEVER
jgi:hypothetical protein